MDDKAQATLLAHHLYSPTFTKLTISAGCMVWGYSNAVDVILHRGTNEQLAECMTASNIVEFKMKMPCIEVDEALLVHMYKTRQIASWDRTNDLKTEIAAGLVEIKRRGKR